MQSNDSIETYAYGMNKDSVCNNMIKQYKYYFTRKDIKEHNPNWPEIPDHLYIILILGDSGFERTNAFLNLINHEPGIDQGFYVHKNHLNQNINY